MKMIRFIDNCLMALFLFTTLILPHLLESLL